MAARTPTLEVAYATARYAVCAGRHALGLRIGCRHPLLDRRLRGLGCENHWHWMTPCNPQSIPRSAADNLLRLRQMDRALGTHGWRRLPASSQAPDGGWREPGYCVLDGDAAAVLALARHCGQLALLRGRLGAAAELVWLDDAGQPA